MDFLDKLRASYMALSDNMKLATGVLVLVLVLV